MMKSKFGKFKIKDYLFLVYLIASIGLIIGLVFNTQSKTKNYISQIDTKEKQISEKEEQIQITETLLDGDNLLVEGKYDEALYIYDNLSNNKGINAFLDNILEKRMRTIKILMDSENEVFDDIKDYQFSLNQRNNLIKSLNEDIDSLSKLYKKDSLQWRQENEELQAEIKRKSKQDKPDTKLKALTFNSIKGTKVHYLGETSDGMANGGGVGIWVTGSIYKGNWVNNLRHGKGVFEWNDSHKYEGEYVKGVREGEGTYYWPSGEKYVGEWANDKRNGFGVLYDRDGNVQFEGDWLNDNIVKK